MCVICGKPDEKVTLTGLQGKICGECHDNILKIRHGKGTIAKEYFNHVMYSSPVARNFVESEFEKYSAIDIIEEKKTNSSDVIDEFTTSSNDLREISSDVKTIKNILIFFAVLTGLNLLCSLYFTIKLVGVFQ